MTDRILCVQLADIGDLVLTTPALSLLRERIPDAHITLLTTPHAAPIIADGLVDDVVTFDKHTFDSARALARPANLRRLGALARQLYAGNYDTVVFFHHFSTWFGVAKFVGVAAASGAGRRIGLQSDRTPFLTDGVPDEGFGAHHQAAYWLQLASVVVGSDALLQKAPRHQGEGFRVRASADDVALPSRTPLVAIHAGSGGYATARRWDPTKFAAVAARLIKAQNAHIVFVGGPGDDTAAVIDVLEEIHQRTGQQERLTDLTGETTLPQLAGVIARCDLFIGADSGVMHIATAVGVPTIAIFGPSNHRAWGPPADHATVLRADVRCAPCSYVGTSVGLRDGCPARTCMRLVTADHVIDAAVSQLNGKPIGTQPASSTPTDDTPDHRDRVAILGVPVDKLTYEMWLDHIAAWIAADDRLYHMCTVNPEFVMIAQRDINFYNILRRADLCLADGVGLLYAARYLGEPLPGRVTGSDGVPAIAERAAREGWRLYFLGAAAGVATRAAEVLRAEYPGLQIVGTYSGSPHPEDEDDLVARVNAANADILFVAYGAPAQDKWIARNAPRLNARVAMGVGGAFDYISGDVPLAPNWMRQIGFEWLYRLARQPWRARRQLRLPAFVIAVLVWRRRSPRWR